MTSPDEDIVSKLPPNVTDKILKRLPLRMVSRMSVLSKQWRRNWLSLTHLAFDGTFWGVKHGEEEKYDWQKYRCIISDILLNHNGPIHEFRLYIPRALDAAKGDTLNLSHWISFISRNGVKKIILENWFVRATVPSHVFLCTKLVKLKLDNFTLYPLPLDFEGFPNLRSLELLKIQYKGDIIGKLIAKCPELDMLRLEGWTGRNHLVVSAPRLRTLTFKGILKSLALINIPNLIKISLCLDNTTTHAVTVSVDEVIKILASLSDVQDLHIGGFLCKVFVAGGITKSVPLELNHLVRLSIANVDLNNSDEFCCTYGMIRSCPYIKYLQLEVTSSEDGLDDEFECSDKCKLGHLLEVKITGIKGLNGELKLIEYLLAISVVLEKLFFNCVVELDLKSELKMQRELLRFPRASAKAQLVSLKS